MDLGAGAGRTYAFFSKKGRGYVGIDFSPRMKKEAFRIHGEFPYILDDMVNIKKHFESNSMDAVFAMYSLFHLPQDDFENVVSAVHDILKEGGLFLFSYQLGAGEEFADEPYLGEKGKNALYMNYQTDDEIESILRSLNFIDVYKKNKIETSSGAINSHNAITTYRIVRKGRC